MADIKVQFKNLVRKFGHFTAVNNISLEVYQGEIFGFLGANGAGKTTTIRMICGLLEPTEGDIYVNGLSVAQTPDLIKKQIGYMSQKFSLYPDLTPAENVDFFGKIYEVPNEHLNQIKEYLQTELQMDDLNSTLTAELPLGFKQRLGLQCSILHNPPIIFLDEPTSGVDPIGRRHFWDKIYHLSESGHTVFVTTHYLDEAEYCHRLAIMNAGEIVALGTPSELKNRYRKNSLQDVFIEAISSK